MVNQKVKVVIMSGDTTVMDVTADLNQADGQYEATVGNLTLEVLPLPVLTKYKQFAIVLDIEDGDEDKASALVELAHKLRSIVNDHTIFAAEVRQIINDQIDWTRFA